ncbi:MAG: D-alanine--D-alanine ligase family protein [Bdellovibrionia bacterium]
MKKNIALIFGGKSAEHEVSVRSAKNIAAALDLEKYIPHYVGISKQGSWYYFEDASVFDKVIALNDHSLIAGAQPVAPMSLKSQPVLFFIETGKKINLDLAFPILHGTMGEDGSIQGLFKMINLPFVGCGVWSSAAGMDKEVMKRLLFERNIPNAKYLLLTPHNPTSYNDVVAKLGSPFFIKPANAGSSVGVHKIKSAQDYEQKLKDAHRFDHKVLAEEFIQGREIECSVKGLNESPQASLPGEVRATHEFYSYEAKYIDEKGAEIIIPAQLDANTVKRIQDMACLTYKTMGCDGLTRVDFFLTEKGELYINEINTIPGFTKISMYPQMWQASGVSYRQLISELIEMGFERHRIDSQLVTDFSL